MIVDTNKRGRGVFGFQLLTELISWELAWTAGQACSTWFPSGGRCCTVWGLFCDSFIPLRVSLSWRVAEALHTIKLHTHTNRIIAERLSTRHLIREYRPEMRCLYVSHTLECVIIAVGISVTSFILLHGVSACAYHHYRALA